MADASKPSDAHPRRRLFSVEETAQQLSISAKEVRRLHYRRDLVAVHVGKRVLFTAEEIERFIQSLVAKSAQASA